MHFDQICNNSNHASFTSISLSEQVLVLNFIINNDKNVLKFYVRSGRLKSWHSLHLGFHVRGIFNITDKIQFSNSGYQ